MQLARVRMAGAGRGGCLPWRLPKRNSALAQVILIGAICFCCPGIYNAVIAMAGGIDDPEVCACATCAARPTAQRLASS